MPVWVPHPLVAPDLFQSQHPSKVAIPRLGRAPVLSPRSSLLSQFFLPSRSHLRHPTTPTHCRHQLLAQNHLLWAQSTQRLTSMQVCRTYSQQPLSGNDIAVHLRVRKYDHLCWPEPAHQTRMHCRRSRRWIRRNQDRTSLQWKASFASGQHGNRHESSTRRFTTLTLQAPLGGSSEDLSNRARSHKSICEARGRKGALNVSTSSTPKHRHRPRRFRDRRRFICYTRTYACLPRAARQITRLSWPATAYAILR